MYKIEGTTITMTRGDTVIITVSIMNGSSSYTPVTGDRVRFLLREKLNSNGTAFKSDKPLLKKNIPTNTMTLRIDPDDTKRLRFDDYFYDIKLIKANGVEDTFISEAALVITPGGE